MTEFTCERCGVLVVQCVPAAPETIYCATCRFIESIDNPADKQAVIEYLDRKELS